MLVFGVYPLVFVTSVEKILNKISNTYGDINGFGKS